MIFDCGGLGDPMILPLLRQQEQVSRVESNRVLGGQRYEYSLTPQSPLQQQQHTSYKNTYHKAPPYLYSALQVASTPEYLTASPVPSRALLSGSVSLFTLVY